MLGLPHRSGRRAQSLDQLDDDDRGAGGIGEAGTPKGTPKSTPKLGHHSLGKKIHSESDLQNAGMLRVCVMCMCMCVSCVYVHVCVSCECVCACVCLVSVCICVSCECAYVCLVSMCVHVL